VLSVAIVATVYLLPSCDSMLCVFGSSLFPTMPRHNFVKVQPLVKSLLKKHNIEYIEKSLFDGMADIARSASIKKNVSLVYSSCCALCVVLKGDLGLNAL